jgi:glycosyltransferase involved in cell wall biosynthesis
VKKIGFCIIVKDESHVIERCLNSVKPIIDWVQIVDTGSTDNTIETIQNWIKNNNIEGEVITEPWQNFAYNRTFALEKLRERDWIDYALMIDADEIISYVENFDPIKFKDNLEYDYYDIQTSMGGHIYNRPQLTSNKRPFRYVGVVHEFLDLSIGGSRGFVEGLKNVPIQDSNRNKSGNKFLKDIELLELALSKEEEGNWISSRYMFYLAQSYRDSGNINKSLECYLKRADMGYWNEEQYISLYNAGNMMKDLGHSRSEVIQTFMRGQEVAPYRAECLYGALLYCRLNALHQQGYIIGKYAMTLEMPRDSLFTESWIYQYGILDEFSIVAFWSRNYIDSKLACEKLINENRVPEHYLPRIKQNLQFAIDRI